MAANRNLLAVLALTLVLPGQTARAQVTSKPTLWKQGFLTIPFERHDTSKTKLESGSGTANTMSCYTAQTVNGHAWPLDTAGNLVVTKGGQPSFSLGYYNGTWSQNGSTPKAGAVRLKTQTTSKPSYIYWDLKDALPEVKKLYASKLIAVVMGVNSFMVNKGKTIGTITLYQDKNGTQISRKLDLVLGTNIRHYRTSTHFCNGSGCYGSSSSSAKYSTWTYETAPPAGATQLYSGACKNPAEQCYLDYVELTIPTADVRYPVTGVEVRAHRHGTFLPSSVAIYGSIRIHALGLVGHYEAVNSGATVTVMKQGDCTAGGGWGSKRYGGRSVGGVIYGPKRSIGKIGCGLVSATMAVKYYQGALASTLTPPDLNTILQGISTGYGSTSFGRLDDFTSGWQGRCAAFQLAGQAVDWTCACCPDAACQQQNCPLDASNNPILPAFGTQAQVQQLCCALGSATGLPSGSGAGGTVEVYPSGYCDQANNTCDQGDIDKHVGPFTSCSVTRNNQPAVIVGGAPRARLEVQTATHPLNQQNCVLMTATGFTTFWWNATTHLPCRRGLKLASVLTINGGSLAAGQAVGYYQMIDFRTAATHYGLQYTPKFNLDSSRLEEEAQEVEGYFSRGIVPILRVKANNHFLVGTGARSRWMTGPVSRPAVSVPATGGFVGTWSVADPSTNTNSDLVDAATGYFEAHSNRYSGWRLIQPGSPSTSLSVRVFSPAELLVIGPSGKKLGWDPKTGKKTTALAKGADYGPVYEDLAPGDTGEAREVFKEAYVPAAAGTYQVAVIGTGFGSFDLQMSVQDKANKAVEDWRSGYVTPGKVYLYSVIVPKTPGTKPAFSTATAVDADKDGYAAPGDCDETNTKVHPGAAEDCNNGKDDDCDGLADAKDLACAAGAKACPDVDKDGHADCTVAGCVKTGLTCGDCDDSRATVNPKASEGTKWPPTCNDGLDNNCDGLADLKIPACKAAAGSPFGKPKPAAASDGGSAPADASGPADTGPSMEAAVLGKDAAVDQAPVPPVDFKTEGTKAEAAVPDTTTPGPDVTKPQEQGPDKAGAPDQQAADAGPVEASATDSSKADNSKSDSKKSGAEAGAADIGGGGGEGDEGCSCAVAAEPGGGWVLLLLLAVLRLRRRRDPHGRR